MQHELREQGATFAVCSVPERETDDSPNEFEGLMITIVFVYRIDHSIHEYNCTGRLVG